MQPNNSFQVSERSSDTNIVHAILESLFPFASKRVKPQDQIKTKYPEATRKPRHAESFQEWVLYGSRTTTKVNAGCCYELIWPMNATSFLEMACLAIDLYLPVGQVMALSFLTSCLEKLPAQPCKEQNSLENEDHMQRRIGSQTDDLQAV